jgi:hypothetical protein
MSCMSSPLKANWHLRGACPSSQLKIGQAIKQQCFACCLLHASVLFGLQFSHEYGGDIPPNVDLRKTAGRRIADDNHCCENLGCYMSNYCFCAHDYVVICALCSLVCNGALCVACGYTSKSTQRQRKMEFFHISNSVYVMSCVLFMTRCKDPAFAWVKFAVLILIKHSTLICS